LRAGTLPFWRLCFVGGGVVAVLVDIDHVPHYIFGVSRLPLPLYIPHLAASRFLHPFSFAFGCGVLACAGGCLVGLVLREVYRARKVRISLRAREIEKGKEITGIGK
jgi:hypothetical protein